MQSRTKVLLLFALVLVLVRCGGGGGGGGESAAPSIQAPVGLVYSSNPAVYTKGIAITPNTATVGGGAATSFAVLPSLPPGLILNSTTGTIQGVPATVSPIANYVVMASNTAGSTTKSLSLTVNDALHKVRVLYVIPSDRTFRQDWSNSIQAAVLDFQVWMANQLGGKTFTLYAANPQVVFLPRDSNYYAVDTWSKVTIDLQLLVPVSTTTPNTAWVVYVDVVHACNTPGRLGAGTLGLTMLPRQDLEGIGGAPCIIDDCGPEYCFPHGRWIGGLGHEMGHMFGLPHPPGCDSSQPTCDYNALMWLGYTIYPNTYFRPEEKAVLLSSPYFN